MVVQSTWINGIGEIDPRPLCQYKVFDTKQGISILIQESFHYFCVQRQHDVNGGKCGICGDAWDASTPRDNEDGGNFGTGRVYRTYMKV